MRPGGLCPCLPSCPVVCMHSPCFPPSLKIHVCNSKKVGSCSLRTMIVKEAMLRTAELQYSCMTRAGGMQHTIHSCHILRFPLAAKPALTDGDHRISHRCISFFDAGNISPCQGAYHELLASMLHAWCRAKMMGFNAARIEWSVDGLATAPKEFTTADCDIATTADIQASMLPPTTADTPQPTGTPTLPQQPPTTGTTGDVCSSDLPNTSTQDRYVYLVHYLCGQVRPHTACISCHLKLPAILAQ